MGRNMTQRIVTSFMLLAATFAALPENLEADGRSSEFFEARGVKIHYLVQGQGEPVVLIHGLYASAEMNWAPSGLIGDLAKDHRVIALDLPGHGRSDKPDDESAYGAQLVEDVVLLLDHLKIKRVHIVGYSLGGMVAVKFMAKHPERVISGSVGGMGWLREGSALAQIWERSPQREGSRTPSALIRTIGKLGVTKEELLSIRVPVKVIVGDRDPVERMYVEPLKEVRSDWPVVEIPDAGHINCVMKPQFREEIASWVRKNSR
jgi:pimeloyl-ACP methyl ester carboxylesterase